MEHGVTLDSHLVQQQDLSILPSQHVQKSPFSHHLNLIVNISLPPSILTPIIQFSSEQPEDSSLT